MSERVWFWIQVYVFVTFILPAFIVLVLSAALPVWGPKDRK